MRSLLALVLCSSQVKAALPEPVQCYCQTRESILNKSTGVDQFKKEETYIPITKKGECVWTKDSILFPNSHYRFFAFWNGLDIMTVEMSEHSKTDGKTKDSFVELKSMNELAVVRSFEYSDDFDKQALQLLICGPDLNGPVVSGAGNPRSIEARVNALADRLEKTDVPK